MRRMSEAERRDAPSADTPFSPFYAASDAAAAAERDFREPPSSAERARAPRYAPMPKMSAAAFRYDI